MTTAKTVDCGFCQGLGTRVGVKCKVCDGVGSLFVLVPLLHCQVCHGTGKVNHWPHRDCRGTGWANVQKTTSSPPLSSNIPEISIPNPYSNSGKKTMITSSSQNTRETKNTILDKSAELDVTRQAPAKSSKETLAHSIEEPTLLYTSKKPYRHSAPTLNSEAPNEDIVPVPCGRCQGKGRNRWGTACPICKELGSILVQKPERRCQGCGGDGVIYNKSHTDCKGSGWTGFFTSEKTSPNSSPVACAQCEGRGQTKNEPPCAACHGNGSVLVTPPATPCAGCDGDGIYGGRLHGACKGTGWAHLVN